MSALFVNPKHCFCVIQRECDVMCFRRKSDTYREHKRAQKKRKRRKRDDPVWGGVFTLCARVQEKI